MSYNSHQSHVQGDNHFPGSADHAISDASQDSIGPHCNMGTLLAHVQLVVS